MAKKIIARNRETIAQALRRRGHQIAQSMGDNEFFGSSEFQHYANTMVSAVLKKPMTVRYIANQETTAYTDGENITLNLNFPSIHGSGEVVKKLLNRFYMAMGALFHECAHCLFVDWKFSNSAIKKLTKKALVGKFDPQTPEQEQSLQEIREFIKYHPMTLKGLYCELLNKADDSHDERCICEVYPGFVKKCIDTTNAAMFNTVKGTSDHGVNALNLLLIFAKLEGFPMEIPKELEELHQQMEPAYAIMAKYRYSNGTGAERWDILNSLVLEMWPLLKKDADGSDDSGNSGQSGDSGDSGDSDSSGQAGTSGSKQSGGSNSSSGSGDSGQSGDSGDSGDSGQDGASGSKQSGGSNSSSSSGKSGQSGDSGDSGDSGQDGASGSEQADGSNSSSSSGKSGQSGDSGDSSDPAAARNQKIADRISEILGSAEEAQNQMGVAPRPADQKGSGQSVDEAKANASDLEPGSEGDFDSICSEIAHKMAEAEMQREMNQAEKEQIRNTNVPLVHRNITVNIRMKNSDGSQGEYDEIFTPVSHITKRMVTSMRELIEELTERYTQHHRAWGPIVEATDSYRPDGLFFGKKSMPSDLPDMAICLLVDESGSMYGKNIAAAETTALVLERFASELNIPIMVAGHHVCSYGEIDLDIFRSFETVKRNSGLPLTNMRAGGCNRDGLALKLCMEQLSQRPEQVKIMIVISDGCPADDGYIGEPARKDIQEVIKSYRDIICYGAAIDDDREIIKEIYGNGFLSITDLEKMPKTFIRLIRNRMFS